MATEAEPALSLHGQWDISASPRKKTQPTAGAVDSAPSSPARSIDHQRRVQGLSDSLRARLRLGDDEILKALKASPVTAPHAEARAREIMNDLITADYRSSAQRAVEQISTKDATIAVLQRELHAANAEAAEGRKLRSQLAAETSRRERLTIQAEALRRDVDDRTAQRKAAENGLQQAQRALADAQARLAAAERAAQTQAVMLEKVAKEKGSGLQQRERDLANLEEAFRAHVSESSARIAEASEREDRLASAHKQTRQDLSNARVEIESLQAALLSAQEQSERQQRSQSSLQDEAARTQADLRELESLFKEAERDHKTLRDQYVAASEQLQAVTRDASAAKQVADRTHDASKLAVQDLERDLHVAQTTLQQAREQLADRNAVIKKLEHRVDLAEANVAQLRREAVDASAQLAEVRALAAAREPGERKVEVLEVELERLRKDRSDLTADLARAKAAVNAGEAQVRDGQQQLALMAEKLEKKRFKKDELKAAFIRDHEERFRLQSRQQTMDLQTRVAELEATNKRLMAVQTEVSANPDDYVPRVDHQRIMASRLDAQATEHKTELGSRINQLEREWRWRFESQTAEQESSAQAELRQVQQEHLQERRRLEDQMASLQQRLHTEQSRSSSAVDNVRQQHAADMASLTDQLAAVQQQARVETARLNGRLESALAEAHSVREDVAETRKRNQELAKQAQHAREQLRVASVKTEGLESLHAELQEQCETLQSRLERAAVETAKQQKQRTEAAAAALQTERAERASMAERLTTVTRERDTLRHDLDSTRTDLAAHLANHNAEMQALAAEHHHALRDIKHSAEDRVAETKLHAKRDIDALKTELAGLQAASSAAVQEAAAALNRAVREAEDHAEERLATAMRHARRENDKLQADLADASNTHEASLKSLNAEHSQALHRAQMLSEEQLAEAHRQATQQRAEHEALLRDAEQSEQARIDELTRQLKHLREEHARDLEFAKDQQQKAVREAQLSEEQAWAEGAARLSAQRDDSQASARKAERLAEDRLEEVNRQLDHVKKELADCEAQRTKLSQAQKANEAELKAALAGQDEAQAACRHVAAEKDKLCTNFQSSLNQLASQVAAKVADLHNQHRALTAEVEEELGRVRVQCITSLQAARDQAEQQAQAATSSIRGLKSQVTDLQQELVHNKELLQANRQQLNAKQAACDDAQAKVAEQAKQLSLSVERTSEAETALAKRTREASNTKAELEALHMALAEAHSRAQLLEASRAPDAGRPRSTEAPAQRPRSSESPREGSKLKPDTPDKGQGFIAFLEGKLSDSQTMLETRRKTIQAKDSELAAAQVAKKSLEAELAAAQDATQHLQQELEDGRRQLAAAQLELSQARRRAETNTANITRLEGEHEASKSAAERKAAEAVDKAQRLERRMHELQQQLDKSSSDVQERVRAATAKLAEADASRQAERNAAASMQASLEAQLASARKEAHGRISAVTRDLDDAKADSQAKNKELSDTSSELARVHDHFRRLKAQLADKRQAAAGLAAALAAELGLPAEVQTAIEVGDAAALPGALAKLRSLVQAHADRHAVSNILTPVEQAMGMARGDGVGTVDELLKSVTGPSRVGHRAMISVLGKDPDTGAPLTERVNRLVAECAARHAGLHQLQAELNRARDKVEAVRKEGVVLAEQARTAAVAPLKAELLRLRDAAQQLEAQFQKDTAGLRATLGSKESAARAEAQGAIEQLQASAATLQAQLASEEDRSSRLETEISHLRTAARQSMSMSGGRTTSTLPLGTRGARGSQGFSGTSGQAGPAAPASAFTNALVHTGTGSLARTSTGGLPPRTTVPSRDNNATALPNSGGSMSNSALRSLLQEIEAENIGANSSRQQAQATDSSS